MAGLRVSAEADEKRGTDIPVAPYPSTYLGSCPPPTAPRMTIVIENILSSLGHLRMRVKLSLNASKKVTGLERKLSS